MKTNWYVVAHRAEARIFEQRGVKPELSLLKKLDNPEGSMKSEALITDKPGRTPRVSGNGFDTFSEEQSIKDQITLNFARQIAHHLNDGAKRNEYDYLVVVAEPQLLGLLRKELDKNATIKLRTTLNKDLARASDREMPTRLREVLFEREPVHP